MNTPAARDVLVAGGGLAGALAALAFARLGLGVTMAEAATPAAKAGDGRSLALSLASIRVFESLELWPALAPHARPITTVHVSEAGRFGQLRLTAREMGVAALGQVVPAAELLAAIETAAVAAGVERLRPAEVSAATLDGEGLRAIEIAGDARRSVPSAKLLIVANGAGSRLAASIGIASRERRYGAEALVTTAAVTHPQPGVAFERFTREGTLALLPRRGRNMGVVWTLAETRADEFAALAPEEFAARVAAAIGGRLGGLTLQAPIRRYPLVSVHALAQTTERAVVIGNAAHALHPIAAQGFNLTVRDIAVLAECAAAAREDVGAPDVLARYARARRRDQARTRTFTGAARLLGDTRLPGASLMRAAGLSVFELVRPLAQEVARQGAGLAPRPLPALVRGASL